MFYLHGLYSEIFFLDPTVRAQYPPQATELPNDESTCPAVQSTQVTEQEDTGGELTSYYRTGGNFRGWKISCNIPDFALFRNFRGY